MKIYVDGKLTDPEMIGWNNHMKYGQMFRFQPNQIFNYVMLFSKDEFLELFSDMFAEQAASFREIDEEEGGEPTEFAAFGYEGLEVGLRHPRAVFNCFDEFMMTDKVLPHLWPNGGGGKYIINCLDRMEIPLCDRRIMLEGRGWNGHEGEMSIDEWMGPRAAPV